MCTEFDIRPMVEKYSAVQISRLRALQTFDGAIFAGVVATLLLGACSTSPPEAKPIVREFDAHGISRVILRGSAAETATATNVIRDAPSVTVTGIPSGGAEGYHSPDPNWRETPASRWGLDFVARPFGSTLVISTKNEIGYIHHHYTLEQIQVQLPAPVRIVRQTRELTGEGKPNLSPP
jgi:hypothetical protein